MAIIAGAMLAGSLLSAYGSSRANTANIGQASQATKINVHQQNTVAQRGVKDLEAAGLNRILAAGGSSAGSGGAAQVAKSENVGGGLQAGLASTAQTYLQNKKQKEEIKLIKAQTKKVGFEGENTGNAGEEIEFKTRLYKFGNKVIERMQNTTAPKIFKELKRGVKSDFTPKRFKKPNKKIPKTNYIPRRGSSGRMY